MGSRHDYELEFMPPCWVDPADEVKFIVEHAGCPEGIAEAFVEVEYDYLDGLGIIAHPGSGSDGKAVGVPDGCELACLAVEKMGVNMDEAYVLQLAASAFEYESVFHEPFPYWGDFVPVCNRKDSPPERLLI